MRIYITRHGETRWNQEGRMQGWQDSPLTLEGIEKAKQLGERLKDIAFQYVYTSPLGRAKETARYVIGDQKVKTILAQQLKEMNFGKWEGMKHSDIEAHYPVQRFNFWNHPSEYETVEGESFEDLLVRARGGLEEILALEDAENILVVSHAIWVKAIYAIIKGYSIEEFWNPPFIKDTSLTILNVEDGKIEIELEADTSHLK